MGGGTSCSNEGIPSFPSLYFVVLFYNIFCRVSSRHMKQTSRVNTKFATMRRTPGRMTSEIAYNMYRQVRVYMLSHADALDTKPLRSKRGWYHHVLLAGWCTESGVGTNGLTAVEACCGCRGAQAEVEHDSTGTGGGVMDNKGNDKRSRAEQLNAQAALSEGAARGWSRVSCLLCVAATFFSSLLSLGFL